MLDNKTRIAWYVTAISAPLKPLAGPYDSRDDCERACLLRLSEHNIRDAAYNHDGNVTRYYVPALFKTATETVTVTTESTHITKSTVVTKTTTPHVPLAQAAPKGIKLNPKIYQLDRKQLVELASALGVDVGTAKHDRETLVTMIEDYLNGA